MRLVYYEENTGVTPRLSFFALITDDDGPEDIEEVRLYHDFEGLLWVFKKNNWVTHIEENNVWIGSHTLSMAGNEEFPSGQWRAVVADKSGERSERVFGFDVPKESKYPFPKFTIENGNWTLESDYPEHFLLCYDQSGNFLRTLILQGKNGTVQTLGLPPETQNVAYWGEDSAGMTAALTKSTAVK
ncbi:MAG: hypothetical protein LBG74_04040 [Spirochaetaceae bacterium]|jgi:hypothetical protein|nr:hypothetical protein [Spirochaetaceae bacterium]